MSSLLAAVDAHPVAVTLRARSYELLGDLTALTDRTVVDVGCWEDFLANQVRQGL